MYCTRKLELAMIGFEVIINKKSLIGGIQDGVISVIIERLALDNRNYLAINFGGYDKETDSHTVWLDEELPINNTITVKVIELSSNKIATSLQNRANRENFVKVPSNIGLEVTVREEVLSAHIRKGSIHLIATLLNDKDKCEIFVDFVATECMDSEDSPKKYWYKKALQLGDSVTIEAKKITKMTI